jgi:hypothetical protein
LIEFVEIRRLQRLSYRLIQVCGHAKTGEVVK